MPIGRTTLCLHLWASLLVCLVCPFFCTLWIQFFLCVCLNSAMPVYVPVLLSEIPAVHCTFWMWLSKTQFHHRRQEGESPFFGLFRSLWLSVYQLECVFVCLLPDRLTVNTRPLRLSMLEWTSFVWTSLCLSLSVSGSVRSVLCMSVWTNICLSVCLNCSLSVYVSVCSNSMTVVLHCTVCTFYSIFLSREEGRGITFLCCGLG